MHKTLEHSDKDCAPSEDAPTVDFWRSFSDWQSLWVSSATGSFVSHRPLTRTERTRNDSKSE